MVYLKVSLMEWKLNKVTGECQDPGEEKYVLTVIWLQVGIEDVFLVKMYALKYNFTPGRRI